MTCQSANNNDETHSRLHFETTSPEVIGRTIGWRQFHLSEHHRAGQVYVCF
jgi:hypothetical protein